MYSTSVDLPETGRPHPVLQLQDTLLDLPPPPGLGRVGALEECLVDLVPVLDHAEGGTHVGVGDAHVVGVPEFISELYVPMETISGRL